MNKKLSIMLIVHIVALWLLGVMAIKTDEKIISAMQALEYKQELSAQVDYAMYEHSNRMDDAVLREMKDRDAAQNQAIEAIADELWLEPHIKAAQDSTVFIDAEQWSGSGVIVSEHWIATARHCVLDAKDFTIRFNNGDELYSDFVFYMEDHDIALIYVEIALFPCTEMKPAVCKSVESLRLGQKVFVVGSPYGDINFNCVTSGIISGLNRDWEEVNPYTGRNYGWEIGFTADASGNPGNSGGPLFDMDGNVRGLLVGGYTSTCVIHMPVDLFLSDLETLTEVAHDPELPMPEGWLRLDNYENPSDDWEQHQEDFMKRYAGI